MNSELRATIIKVLLLAGTMVATYFHSTGNLTPAIAGDIVDIGAFAWSLYSNRAMKLVPKASIAVQPIVGKTVADERAGEVTLTGVTSTNEGYSAPMKVVGAILIAFALSAVLAPSLALAQDPLAAAVARVNKRIAATVAPVTQAGAAKKPCDITLFTKLDLGTIVSDIQNCVGALVSGGAAPFVSDIQKALDSAKAAQDGMATACYTPALAIAQAAVGTPASADGTVPASVAGPITIFQKAREFATAGGPANCKAVFTATTQDLIAGAL